MKRIINGLTLTLLASVSLPGLAQEVPSALTPTAPLRRIAFGSCAHHTDPQPIWETIVASRPDLFLFLGDTVYANSTDPRRMQAAFDKLAAKPGFQKLRRTCPLLAVWDDHDYGLEDGGAEHPNRKTAQQVFLDFFGEPADSPRRRQAGIYHARVYGPPGRRVQIILLDTRYHRSRLETVRVAGRPLYVPNYDKSATMLGQQQWQWLERELARPAELRLLVSSIQVLPDVHPFEKWSNLPRERKRLLEMIRQLRAAGVILISGDQHMGEISRLQDAVGYDLYEITSSGLTHTRGWLPAPNRHRLGLLVLAKNFGEIEIDWHGDDPGIVLSIRDEQGQARLSQQLRLSQLKPGDKRDE